MSELVVHDWPLPYITELAERRLAEVDLVVIHCTELPDLATARSYGERTLYADGTGNSGHYYIDRSGAIYTFVPNHRMAHHTRGFNPRSIGIELVNTGRYPDWLDSRHQDMDESYPDGQIERLLALLTRLQQAIPSLSHIAGHEDLDTGKVPASDNPRQLVSRKRDPGPQFPWQTVLQTCTLTRLHGVRTLTRP